MALPPAAFAQDPSAGEATLNFVGADIESVVKAVGHYINKTFIIDPRVKGTINLVSEKPVTKAQAFNLLSSALRLQGYAVVSTDNFIKVVPEADAKLQAGPVAQARSVQGDQIATQVFRLNYEPAMSLVTVLRPLISPNNTITANPGNNTLVITDYADNLKRLGKIIAALDTPASGDMDVVPIKYAMATDIATMVNRLLEQTGGTQPGEGRIMLLADPRINSVIVRAPSTARANLAKSLIAKLDQPTAEPGNVHVVYLRNADAMRLAQTLRAVVASDTAGAGTSTTTPGVQPQMQSTQNQQNQNGLGGSGGLQQAAPLQSAPQPAALPSGGPAGFIQADPATNSLIITASEPVYRNLRTVIDQLDARRAQVYIESLIVEVTSDRAAEFGVQWAGLSGNDTSTYRVGTLTGFGSGGNNLINLAAQKLAGTSAASASTTGVQLPSNGLNLGVFRQIGGALTLGAIAHALETEGGTNILSMPNLITLDNEEARIIVGQNVPFVTGQYTNALAGASGVNPFQTIERQDVGLALRVRPQVSEGGSVKMSIYQESSNVQSNTASGIITNKRSIETNVLVDDGQIIVLGGLMDDSVDDSTEKVPGLGDIPVVGNLFKYQTRHRAKRNLMVFLRPIVIRTNEQSVALSSDRYGYIRNAELGAAPEQKLTLPNLGAPMLPPLENGHIVNGPMYDLTRQKIAPPAHGPQPLPPQAAPVAPAGEPVAQPVPQPAAPPATTH